MRKKIFIFTLSNFTPDTGIAEEIMAYTVTPEFNKALEVQQSNHYYIIF
jgi:hypothetical protein